MERWMRYQVWVNVFACVWFVPRVNYIDAFLMPEWAHWNLLRYECLKSAKNLIIFIFSLLSFNKIVHECSFGIRLAIRLPPAAYSTVKKKSNWGRRRIFDNKAYITDYDAPANDARIYTRCTQSAKLYCIPRTGNEYSTHEHVCYYFWCSPSNAATGAWAHCWSSDSDEIIYYWNIIFVHYYYLWWRL